MNYPFQMLTLSDPGTYRSGQTDQWTEKTVCVCVDSLGRGLIKEKMVIYSVNDFSVEVWKEAKFRFNYL